MTQDYRAVADELASDIRAGRLRPGDRLPPQRIFARQHGIATSTAGRVYRELHRRGLTVGEVGRGTFVRATPKAAGSALVDPHDNRIDLEVNYPTVPEEASRLGQGIARLLRPDLLAAATRPLGVVGTPAARAAVATLLTRDDWRPAPERILFAGNGRQAIAAAIGTLVPAGCRLGVEELTYPVVRAIVSQLGVIAVPLPMDEDGLVPEAIAAAHGATPLKAVYVQPTMHNPLSHTMSAHRRAALAGVAVRCGLHVVEDNVWCFLRDDVQPLAALLPDQTIVVDSLSKRLTPGLTVGFAVVPGAMREPLAATLRSFGWGPSGFALAAATLWANDGSIVSIAQAKKRDAAARQLIAARHLANFTVRTSTSSYYCWWELPRRWRTDMFVAAAARRGIAVTPGAAFTLGPSRSPNNVRIGLASPEPDVLDGALRTLATIARSSPEALGED